MYTTQTHTGYIEPLGQVILDHSANFWYMLTEYLHSTWASVWLIQDIRHSVNFHPGRLLCKMFFNWFKIRIRRSVNFPSWWNGLQCVWLVQGVSDTQWTLLNDISYTPLSKYYVAIVSMKSLFASAMTKRIAICSWTSQPFSWWLVLEVAK